MAASFAGVSNAPMRRGRTTNVLADARKMLEDLGVRSADFSADYKDGRSRVQKELRLPKRETLILVSGYNVQMRAKIIESNAHGHSFTGSLDMKIIFTRLLDGPAMRDVMPPVLWVVASASQMRTRRGLTD